MEVEEGVRTEVLSRFPQGSVLAVELRPAGDHLPDEAGKGLVLLLVPRGPEEYNAIALEDSPKRRRGIPEAVYTVVVNEFRKTHAAALGQLGRDLPQLIPGCTHLGVRYGGYSGEWTIQVPPEQRHLTAVMARLDPTDLETLDTLIAAGCATSRADAMRWALGCIRERPAFQQLRERVREMETLKAAL